MAREINRWWSDYPDEIFWFETTDRDDVGADLNAPAEKEGGGDYWSYDLVQEVRPGDIVAHYFQPTGTIQSSVSDHRSGLPVQGVLGRSWRGQRTWPGGSVLATGMERLAERLVRAHRQGFRSANLRRIAWEEDRPLLPSEAVSPCETGRYGMMPSCSSASR